MNVLRNQPKGARFASFGLGLCIFALMPTEIGYQDIASLLARQPGVAERWQKRVFSAGATIQVATYSFGLPIGTSSPQAASLRLASLDSQGVDVTGSIPRNPVTMAPPRYQAADVINYPQRPVSECPSAVRPARRGILPPPGQPGAPPV